MSYPPPPEPFPESQPYPAPADPAFQPPSADPLFQPPPAAPQSGPPQSGPPQSGPPQSGPPQSGPPQSGPQSGPPAFQPGVASPSYPRADHPQTGYQQPAYPPTTPFPGYGPAHAPGHGPMPGAVPPRKPGGGSGALLWSLIAVFALLLCAGAATAGFIAYRNTDAGTNAEPSHDPVLPGGTGRPDPTAPPTQERTEDPATREPSAPAGGAVVTYEVTGDGPATIQYLKADSQIESLSGESLPWRVELQMPKTNFLVSLTASRDGGGSGRITCRVLVNGKTVAKQTSGGTLAIVACLDFDLDFD